MRTLYLLAIVASGFPASMNYLEAERQQQMHGLPSIPILRIGQTERTILGAQSSTVSAAFSISNIGSRRLVIVHADGNCREDPFRLMIPPGQTKKLSLTTRPGNNFFTRFTSNDATRPVFELRLITAPELSGRKTIESAASVLEQDAPEPRAEPLSYSDRKE